ATPVSAKPERVPGLVRKQCAQIAPGRAAACKRAFHLRRSPFRSPIPQSGWIEAVVTARLKNQQANKQWRNKIALRAGPIAESLRNRNPLPLLKENRVSYLLLTVVVGQPHQQERPGLIPASTGRAPDLERLAI